MTSRRTRQVRLIDMAGGDSAKGLLFYIDAAGRVMAALAPGEAGLRGLAAGALEMYTLSDNTMAEALAAAVQAAAGRAAWAPAPAQGRDTDEREGPTLTAREREVLRLVARGLSNEAVAEALDIRTCTVRFHLRNTYAKLGVSGRSEAIAWAAPRRLN